MGFIKSSIKQEKTRRKLRGGTVCILRRLRYPVLWWRKFRARR